jgi:hypothetical protein
MNIVTIIMYHNTIGREKLLNTFAKYLYGAYEVSIHTGKGSILLGQKQ